MKVINLFDESECDSIIQQLKSFDYEIKVTNNFGSYEHAAKESNIESVIKSYEIKNLINNKIKSFTKDLGCKISSIDFVKYESHNINKMKLHYDWSKYTIIIELNNNYKGGGTGMPFFNYYHKPQEHKPGSGIIFKSMNFFSYHCGMEVIDGVRYVMVITLKNNKSYKLRYFWKIPYLFFRDVLFGKFIFNFYFHKIINFKYNR